MTERSDGEKKEHILMKTIECDSVVKKGYISIPDPFNASSTDTRRLYKTYKSHIEKIQPDALLLESQHERLDC